MGNIRPHRQFAIVAEQLVAARSACGLSVKALAEFTDLGVNTIRRAEAGGASALTVANALRLTQALESLGITFLEGDDRGPGIRYLRLAVNELTGELPQPTDIAESVVESVAPQDLKRQSK